MNATRTLLLAALIGCGPAPSEVCFETDNGLGRDATTGEVCSGAASPIGYSLAGPNVQLVVDRSRSMSAGGRWDAIQSLTPLLPLVGERANLGLSVFPGPDDAACGVHSSVVVPVQEGVAAAESIRVALETLEPDGATPMAAMLTSVGTDPAMACPNRDNVVVLLSDGGESCGGDPAAAVHQLATASPPVEVYVIGFGVSDATAVILDDVAEAARPSTPAPNFYRADTVDQLVERLHAVTGTCTVQLYEDVGAEELLVGLDGRALSECTEERCEEGFTYDEAYRTVTFEGADCLALLDGTCHDFAFDRR